MWYKVADGPLTIANSPLTVTIAVNNGGGTKVSLPPEGDEADSTLEIEYGADEWKDISNLEASSGNVYMLADNGSEKSQGHQLEIYVLDDAVLDGYNTSWDSSTPMSGIFVSDNVREITIPAQTIYHKVPAEYLDSAPVTISATVNGVTYTNMIYVSMSQGDTMNLPIYLEPGHITPLEIYLAYMSGDGIASISDNLDGSIYIAASSESSGSDICIISAEENRLSCGGMLVIKVEDAPK